MGNFTFNWAGRPRRGEGKGGWDKGEVRAWERQSKLCPQLRKRTGSSGSVREEVEVEAAEMKMADRSLYTLQVEQTEVPRGCS